MRDDAAFRHFWNWRGAIAILLCGAGVALAMFGTRPAKPTAHRGKTLSVTRLDLNARTSSPTWRPATPDGQIINAAPLRADAPIFGHPVISGIGGTGFEQAIRLDPSNPDRIYTSTPGTLSADTSWIWRSLDAGKTFKWIPNAAPLVGKVTTCHGGGDTELAVDGQGRLYFNDLTLANFSTGRSDDFGVTMPCTNTAVPDVVVDRQWYAIDGDPLNGGTIYLTNDEVGQSTPVCGNAGDNILVAYRSPVTGLPAATAGLQFGPPNRINCNEGIMGNVEVSPVATTLGQPEGAGGYATLPTPVKHIYIAHDSANLQKIFMARCFPVAFGPTIANVSDPSGLNCTFDLVSDLGPNAKTGGDFPTMAVDTAGNLYIVWEEAPLTAGVISGDVVLKFSVSTDQGRTWSTPVTIDTSGSPFGTLHQNVFAWLNAGDPGRVNIAWYGTDGTATTGARGPDDCTDCLWYLFMTQSLNALDPNPTFTAPILASQHHIHKGTVQTLIGGQNQFSSRALGDFLQMRVGSQGEAHIAYADSNRLLGAAVSHGMYVRQNGGTGLYAASSPVSVAGLTPFNSVDDPAGDGKYEAGGIVSANMPQLDILRSSVARVTTAPCSEAAPCYHFSMVINNLSLAPSLAQDPDPDLVWLTQWFVPSPEDPDGGKNYLVYAEAFSDGPNPPTLQCHLGESANFLVSGGATISISGNDPPLPAANCQMTPGPNGTIDIYLPISSATVPGAIDDRLHEVTASTMTLPARGNSNPQFAGIGGVPFNLIDVAQGYLFDPDGGPGPSPTPTPSPTATASPTPSASPSPSATPTPTATPTASPTATPSPSSSPAQLANISGRVVTQTGDNVGIGGWIVRGPGFKRMLVRAIGPSMSVGGKPVPGALQDPTLELHDSRGGVITNDNWQSSQEQEIRDTGLAPTDPREAAVLVTVPAGGFTAIGRGANNTTGIALIEIYDLGPPGGESNDNRNVSQLANLSVRAMVQTDDNVLIDGVILRGIDPPRVLFRALGPSVRVNGQPVPGALQNPTLDLHDGNGVLLATNDNWRNAPNAAEIESSGLKPGDDREAAILMRLAPGHYTAITRGVDRTTGIGLAEVYNLGE